MQQDAVGSSTTLENHPTSNFKLVNPQLKKETPTETVKSNVSPNFTKHNAVVSNKMLEAKTLERQSTTSKLVDTQSATSKVKPNDKESN